MLIFFSKSNAKPYLSDEERGQGTRPRPEGDAGESGSPKSECFLGERKHSEALSFLSKAKKRLAELRADEVVDSSLAVILQ